MPDATEEGRPVPGNDPQREVWPPRDTGAILPQHDDRSRARARLRMLDERLRVGKLAHQGMPLTVWYGPRPLLDVPIGQLPTRGRWCAA